MSKYQAVIDKLLELDCILDETDMDDVPYLAVVAEYIRLKHDIKIFLMHNLKYELKKMISKRG